MTDRLADFEGEIPWDLIGAAGYRGAFFYISHSTKKEPSVAWVQEGLRRGFLVIPVFEDTGHASSGGAPLGAAHAAFAIQEMDRFKLPSTSWVANAESDYDASPGNVTPYYSGFYSTFKRGRSLGRILTYAGGAVDRLLKQLHLSDGAWRTCSGGFQGSRDLTGLDIIQVCAGQKGLVPIPGHSVDTDLVVNPAIFLAAPVVKPFKPIPYPGRMVPGKVSEANGVLKFALTAAGEGAFLTTGNTPAGHRFDKATLDTVKAVQQLHEEKVPLIKRWYHGKRKPDGRPGRLTWRWINQLIQLRQAQS